MCASALAIVNVSVATFAISRAFVSLVLVIKDISTGPI